MTFVPSKRLVSYAFGLVAVAVIAGPLAPVRPAAFLLVGVVVLVALADLALSLARHRPVHVSLPDVSRLTKDRPGKIPVMLRREDDGPRSLRFGLAWPEGIESTDTDQHVLIPAGAKQARIELDCTPRRRGRRDGLLACVETASRWGLWLLRTRQTLAGEIRVYPNLFGERRQLASLFLARAQQGSLMQRTVGRGREFEKLREYLPGDGFDEIHWKATAKRGRPITKIFQVERTQEIYVIVDMSRLSGRAVELDGVQQTALERSITAALVLLRAAEAMGDRFGFVAHDDRVRIFLRAGRGESHYGACREAVLGLQANEATPDLPEIVRHLRGQLRQRALLFFLTDLTDPVLAEDFVRHVPLLSRQHLVIVGQLRSPEVAPLFTGADAVEEQELYGKLAGHARWTETRVLAQKLKPLGVTVAQLENETMAAQVVAQYMQVKRRQVL